MPSKLTSHTNLLFHCFPGCDRLLLVCSDATFAKSSRKSNAAAAAARKKKAIESVRAQIAAAKQVLVAAEAAAGASRAQLDDIHKRLSDARVALADALDEECTARKELLELEAKILGTQSRESEFGRAQAKLANTRSTTDAFRARYGDDRNGLNSDADYLAAADAYAAAKREFDRTRAATLAENKDWQAASQELRDLLAEHREEMKSGSGSFGMMPTSRNLRNAEDVAAAARQVIAEGEARLRQLGENPASVTAKKNGTTVKK